MKTLPPRVVLVDNDQGLRQKIRRLIEESGYEGSLATCGSGQELLLRLRELQPELIILDLKMPDMDGLDVLQALHDKADFDTVPVILCTSKMQLEMIEKYRPLGLIGVLHKPYDFETLVDDLRMLWHAHIGHDADEDGEAAVQQA